ncbi:ETC complex I subunit [Sphingomonas ginkgonis]|uniref:ETC complex I subunit n=1 Tax=Sphingomonas ginkgonis TaxID=2315330 RepID=A0A3R9YNC5_9SPHN|nr:NADH dehydrogenase ubiquinone Fe-S protein 4 [Sphingomonas ginkgonis]RST31424.1 ETC complex I subunit [Sphingomonas ginkgonis]
MSVARIIELDRKTTQSGKAKNGRWMLEFERQEALKPDPLTGWNGSGDTNTQVRLYFGSKEEAVAYADRKGLAYHLVVAPPVRLKIQAYADNFR